MARTCRASTPTRRVRFALVVALAAFGWLASLLPAAAQTAADLARLAAEVPASTSRAPIVPGGAGGASPRDLARLTGEIASDGRSHAPTVPGNFAGAFSAADLARLRGSVSPASGPAPTALAANHAPPRRSGRRSGGV